MKSILLPCKKVFAPESGRSKIWNRQSMKMRDIPKKLIK